MLVAVKLLISFCQFLVWICDWMDKTYKAKVLERLRWLKIEKSKFTVVAPLPLVMPEWE